MKITLPSGKCAQIGVKYTIDETTTNRNKKTKEDQQFIQCRGAHIRLTIDGPLGGIEEEARSVCKPPDQFSRKEARKYAVKHLLDKVGRKLNKEDCNTILKAICPNKPSYRKLKKENNYLKRKIKELYREKSNLIATIDEMSIPKEKNMQS